MRRSPKSSGFFSISLNTIVREYTIRRDRIEKMLSKLNSEDTKLERLHPSVSISHFTNELFSRTLTCPSSIFGFRLTTPRFIRKQKFSTRRLTLFLLIIFFRSGIYRLQRMSWSRMRARILLGVSSVSFFFLGTTESSRLYFSLKRVSHPGGDSSSE